MDTAFTYVKGHKLESESDYPYRAYQDTCHFASAKGKVGVTGFVDVPANNQAQLEAAVAK